MNSTCGTTHMEGLSGVFFHMYTFDFNPKILRAFVGIDSDIKITVDTDRLVILRSLKILWHIWIEVILTGKTAVRSDRAIQR